jgi:hypothetical protein
LSRDKSRYALAREPYKKLYPQARMHHMRPTSRQGLDVEYNLFPWNERSHAAWHLLFSVMTVREVWPILPDAHMLIFQSESELLIREWCLPYRYEGKRSEQKDMQTPQKITRLQEAWFVCFGSTDLRSALRLVRYMMLYMVFGRHADRSLRVYHDTSLRALLADVNDEPDRSWAFRQCFGRVYGHGSTRSIKKIIRRVRANARLVPIR